MATTAEYLNKLVSQKNTLADNLVTKGVTATHDETLETLVPKVLDISGGQGGNGIYPVNENGIPTGDVIIPEHMTRIPYLSSTTLGYATPFYRNPFVTSVKLHSGINTIDASAFYNCTALTEVNLEDTKITRLETSTFSGCSSLDTLIIPEGVTYLGDRCCMNAKITHLSIPSTFTSMSNYPFSNITPETITIGLLSSAAEKKMTSTSASAYIFNAVVTTNCTTITLAEGWHISARFDDFTALSHDCILAMFNALATVSETKVLTIGETNIAKMTEDEIAIATAKGWTIA